MSVIWEERNPGVYTATANKEAPREESLKSLCDKLIRDVLPGNQQVPWDCIKVEIWYDSGRLIVYPGKLGSPYRIEKAVCQMIFEELLHAWETLADAYEDGILAENLFDQRSLALQKAWGRAFLDALRQLSLAGRRIVIYSAEEECENLPPLFDVVL